MHFRAAAASNGWHQDPGHAHVSRGMEIEPDGGWHPDVAHRILNGTATHDDVLGHVDTDHVGHYWSTHSTTDPGSLREPRSYAEPHEPISNWTPHAEPGENVLGAAGVVLVGHRPHGWNPDDNPDDGLMGNSHLPDHSHIPLHEIHYTGDGENWHTLTPPAGTTVHTDGQHHTATAHDGTLHIGYVGLHDYDKAINRLSSLTDFFREASLQETASMDDEHLDLYHRTTPEAAAAIYRDKRMTSKERIGNDRPVFFSTFRGDEEDAQGRGYGEGVVHVRVPHEIANIDDEFPSGEEHYWVHAGHLKPEHFVEPTHHTATLQATAAEQQFLQRQAAAVLHDKGVMVALVPPREVAEQLAREDGQPADQLHVTLAYLGNTSDYTREQLQLLPQIVGAWAVRRKPVHVRIGGIGTFNNAFKGEHVLWAAADIPDGAQMHSSLAHYLEGHGYRLPSEHGWTPHLTLAYVDRHHRFMPRLDEHHWDAEEVVTFIGGTRHPARLFGRPSTPATL
ncbi:2'-5' RNA ligase family protein [Streptomyces sp. MH60]|uniref:2'-5' RNA ligase family protein n=1 Tax=Streptomyces sp. MH60 TaxID=1940758 RepID=UPI0013009ADF|nr:2'-5' RNA ligase family protein [Streptomyces sp. MH60]